MSVKSHVMSRVVDQFHHPRGVYGRIAGRIMATRDTNVGRNQWIAEILQPSAGAKILEIGHGPGIAIEALLDRLDGGHLTGLEISELMSRAAARRNRDAVARGVVDFRVGDSASLPDDLDHFDLIYAVNATMFWTDPPSAVAHLASRLSPRGELVIAYMQPPTSKRNVDDVTAEISELCRSAGLTDITTESTNDDRPCVATRARRTTT